MLPTKPIQTLLLLTVLAVGMAACDSNGGDDSFDIIGTWSLQDDDGDVQYLIVSETTVKFYDYLGDAYDQGDDCYVFQEFAVAAMTTTALTARFVEGSTTITQVVNYSVSGDTATLTTDGDRSTWIRSADRSYTPLCS